MTTIGRFTSSLGSLLSVCVLLGAVHPASAQTIYTPYHFTTIAGAAGIRGAADGVGSAAHFFGPEAVAVNSSGDVYVADTGNDTVRKITPTVAGGMTTWTVTTLAGTAGVGGSADGTGAAAQFTEPDGLYIDGSGTVYVGCEVTTILRQITSGGVVTTLVPTDSRSLLASRAYAVDPSGNQFLIYAAPVRAFSFLSEPCSVVEQPTTPGAFQITLMNGSATSTGGYTDGSSTIATESVAGLSLPGLDQIGLTGGIALDTNDSVYLADAGNDLIRKITPMVAGGVTTWYATTLGGVAFTSGSADGTAATAQFNGPYGVAVDSSGNVYVADTGSNTIRMGTPNHAPVVTNGTASATLGHAITFTLPATDADGDALTYAITGTTGGTATLAGNQATFTPSATGAGTVAFTANDGYATSNTGTITITTVLPVPMITLQAVSQTVASGRTAVFNAIASGSPTPTYQWTLNGSTTIPGAAVTTDSILMITGATSADAGTYVCTATNSLGTATTSATLTVAATSNPGYLTNLSGRGGAGSGAANAVIGGFVISGGAPKQLLLRGMGPGLNTYFGLGGNLTATQLTLYNTAQAAIAQNATWGGTAALVTAQATLGAYTVPTTSLDSMLYPAPIAPAAYSAAVSGVGSATGVAAVEVYDADAAPPASKLVNVSVRVPVGTGGNILVGGFVIGGSTAETVLIRGLGPGLTYKFGLTGTLAQPVLTLFQGLTQIYSNTVWGGDPVLMSAQGMVGGYAIQSNSADSLLLVTLPPGGYTAQISGANGTTGIAAVEIYEVQ